MIIQSSFKAAWWLKNAHLQTLYPSLLRKTIKPSLIRERLNTPDGDFIDVDFCGTNGQQPLVILLHGLTGSAQSSYIQGLQTALAQQHFRSVALNFRGCSGEYNRSSRCYHSGETGDIDFLYRTLRQREPQSQIAAVGFSLGGNVLLKWLGEQAHTRSLFAAVAVSVPLVLGVCAHKLDTGFSRLYRANLLAELKTYIRRKEHALNQQNLPKEAALLADIGNLQQVNSFWDYDQRVIAHLYHFDSAQDYYQKCSSRQFLRAIKTPTLIIQAHDDPFMTPEILPNAHELSASVTLEISKQGGHVGFISGQCPFQAKYWLEQRIPEFLSAHLGTRIKDLVPTQAHENEVNKFPSLII